MTTEPTSLATVRADKAKRIAAELDSRTQALMDVMPGVMTVERFKRVVVQAVSKNDDLLDCTPESIVRAVMEAAQNGLEPTGPFGGAHLVPFGDQATLVVDYRGLVKMALRGDVADVESRIVFEGDMFEFQLGTEPYVRHVPAVAAGAERGKYRLVYTVLRFKDPKLPPHIDYLTMAEVDKVRDHTRNKGLRGPWRDWYDEMAKKTALRQALKLRATTPEIAEVLEREDAIEGVVEPAPLPSGRRQRLIARFGGDAQIPTETAADPVEVSTDIQAENEPPRAALAAERDPADIEEASPPVEDVRAERDPAVCGDPSPFGDDVTCDRPPDHKTLHGNDEARETWPILKMQP